MCSSLTRVQYLFIGSLLRWSESESEIRSVVSDSLWPHRLYSPWKSPGQNAGVRSLSLLQGIFPTQELNQGLLHCRWILYQLSCQGGPNYHTTALISHPSEVKPKILQARLQQCVNREFLDVQVGFRKGRGTRDQIANIHWIRENAREFQKNFCFIDYTKAFDCVDHNKLWKIL